MRRLPGHLRPAASLFLIAALLAASLTVSWSTPAEASVDATISYATSHWNWPVAFSATPAVAEWGSQDYFQCAEFVARALAAGGTRAQLNATTPQPVLSMLQYRGRTYDVLYVAELYRLLLDTRVGNDVPLDRKHAVLGSVIVYGDFEHVALVTSTGGLAGPLVTAHNGALLNYPVSAPMYQNSARTSILPVTHIVQIDYSRLAAVLPAITIGAVISPWPSPGPASPASPSDQATPLPIPCLLGALLPPESCP